MATRDIYESGFDEESGKTITATECPECAGQLATEGGEIACVECGLIVNEYHLDHSSGARQYSDGTQDRRRTGAPLTTTRHDRGLSAEIGFGRDGKGNTISGKKRRQLARLRREHSRAKWGSKAERNLGVACTEIARMTSALGLAYAVREDASQLFREAQNADLIRGRSIETLTAGSVYAACRRGGYTQTTADVATVARCSGAKVTLGYSVLNRELQLAIEPRTPPEFVPRIASELDCSRETERRARELAKSAFEQGIAIGANPAGVAAGCLAVVVEDRDLYVTQADIADAADVSTVTLRKHRDRVRGAFGTPADSGAEVETAR
ncbi:MAG: transcription initiation factor IIB family protein [Halorhabdus sp.]